MDFLPEDEKLLPHIDLILSGITEFNKAAEKRIFNTTSGYERDHLDDLNRIRKSLLDIQVNLQRIKNYTP